MQFGSLTVLFVILVLAVIIAFSSLRIANEYERGVVFRLGRLIALRGPGLFFIIPFGVDRLVKIDLRVITLEERGQFLLDYIDLLIHERTGEADGFRHVAPGPGSDTPGPAPERRDVARGHDRWVINKLRALNSWYTKGLDNGSHLRISVNAAESIPHLRAIIEDFFFAPVDPARDELAIARS